MVRTRQVRALTEKYYGRTARLFDVHGYRGSCEAPGPFMDFFRNAMNEYVDPAPGGTGGWWVVLTLAACPHPVRGEAQEFYAIGC